MEDLKKLLAAATPGPWQIVMARNDDGVTSYMIREHTHPSVVVERDQYWEDDYQPKTDADGYWLPDENMDALPHRTGNAALIVAAVNALPELLAKLERLEEAFSGPAAWLDRWAQHVGNCKGGDVCTCGLTFVRTEARAAALNQEPGQ